MQVSEFKRIVGCFSETPTSFDMAKGEFVLQMFDEVIVARFERNEGSLFVVEDDVSQPAERWLVRRVARLPQLAERILRYVPEVPNFVTPSAKVLPSLESSPSGDEFDVDSAIDGCNELLETQLPGTTSVIYLTSDAGEGKTTTINVLARQIAQDYKNKEKDWLLLPVPLGGRTFLRLDELVVAALSTRFRFQYWFFEGFIELVRLGVVVPAFDGFEEMMVEGSSGEAVSALGNLMSQLNSEGKVLFAARKAFFEYQSFKTQARLFDAIGSEDSVSFSRVALQRWTREQFEIYGALRGRSDASTIYDQVAARFSSDHPLLTRAVLVRRLFDVASSTPEVDNLLSQLGGQPQDYFHAFVLAIVEREAEEKWLDKEGREGQVLLTIDEHLTLLAAVAKEMWISSTDTLRDDVMDVVADLFCEENRKGPALARQIRERVKHHALLVRSGGARGGLSFDHADFRQFFVGVALGGLLLKGSMEDVRTFLRVSSVPDETGDEALFLYFRDGGIRDDLVAFLIKLGGGELQTSFVLENAGNLLLRAINFVELTAGINVSGLSFGTHALRAKGIKNVRFEGCYFSPTSLYQSQLDGVRFESCQFERIELSAENDIDALLDRCEVSCVVDVDGEDAVFDPVAIRRKLAIAGFHYTGDQLSAAESSGEPDVEMVAIERAVRSFMRATQHNENTLRMKLGVYAAPFFDSAVPELLRVGVLETVGYRGAGNQARYRLVMQMSELQAAITAAGGNFPRFLRLVADGRH